MLIVVTCVVAGVTESLGERVVEDPAPEGDCVVDKTVVDGIEEADPGELVESEGVHGVGEKVMTLVGVPVVEAGPGLLVSTSVGVTLGKSFRHNVPLQ